MALVEVVLLSLDNQYLKKKILLSVSKCFSLTLQDQLKIQSIFFFSSTGTIYPDNPVTDILPIIDNSSIFLKYFFN